ncbi:MFS transporter [Pullulanibacillus sp. KACC 23026]|uniref:MFS transporter n=1 Tax=Pullulanibacillus sp. KACC 23026 TaxID=3028315 RepID=UPI0023B1BD0F|nr:MFS transporter [Pullulanibacillus sp. KACC 23026]WEG11207.1 MFS transporter [Pullulanibacillus sp. KACC 23026]
MKLSSKVALLAGMGGLLDGYDLIVVAGAISLISKSFSITSSAITGLIIGTAFLGGFFGSIFLSRLVDISGRKMMFVLDLFLFVGGTLIAGLAVNTTMLFIGRFLTGLAIGVDLAVSWTLVAEFSPKERRGFLLSLQFIMWGIGAVLSFLVLDAFLGLGNGGAWRAAFLIGLIPAIIVLWIRKSIPESPRWLAAKGKVSEANDIIINSDMGVTIEELTFLNSTTSDFKWTSLFSRQLMRLLVGVFLSTFLAFFLIAPINLFTPQVLKTIGLTGDLHISLLGSAFVWLFNIAGFLVGGLLIDKTGRRPVGIFSFGLMTLILVILLAFKLPADAFFILWICMEFLGSLGASVTWTWASELFPTAVRGFAMGVNSSANRLSGFVSSYIIALILSHSVKLLYLSGIGAGIVILLITIFVINVESKGKALEDISERNIYSDVKMKKGV